VRLYSNLRKDLFNKEHKQKEEREMRGGGGGLTLCKNCKITIRIFRRKNRKKGKNRAPQCLALQPLFCPIPRLRSLKRGGSQNSDTLN
jgi:hypothetical protein